MKGNPHQKSQKKTLRVNVVLNNKEAPTHDTNNTCSRPRSARNGAQSKNCATQSECEWPILEPTRMRGATLSTLTELKMKVITNSVLSKYACLHDFQWCSDRCCTTRSRRQNNYQIQQALLQLITNSREEEPNFETSHKQRWDPTVRQNTADDDDNDTSCQMPAPCWAKESPQDSCDDALG